MSCISEGKIDALQLEEIFSLFSSQTFYIDSENLVNIYLGAIKKFPVVSQRNQFTTFEILNFLADYLMSPNSKLWDFDLVFQKKIADTCSESMAEIITYQFNNNKKEEACRFVYSLPNFRVDNSLSDRDSITEEGLATSSDDQSNNLILCLAKISSICNDEEVKEASNFR